MVSIPIGFSIALRLNERKNIIRDQRLVSIPIGFSIALRLYVSHDGVLLGINVSIPIGFSIALRRWGPPLQKQNYQSGFNPYRVFYSAAT